MNFYQKIFLVVFIGTVLMVSPTVLSGQSQDYGFGVLVSSFETLKKDTGYGMPTFLLRHIALMSEYNQKVQDNNLKKDELDKQKEKLQILEQEQQSVHNKLTAFTTKNGKTINFDQMYEEYDTCMLLRQKGHYGDEAIEQTMDALLVCHRANAVLSCKYDKRKVNIAIEKLKSVKNVNESFIGEIENALNNYGQLNEQTKNWLMQLIKETDESEIELLINDKNKIDITSYLSYPYLYDIIIGAINNKLSDPTSNLSTLIKNKL